MKYTSKKQVIEIAQNMGSTAKTYKNAARYILHNTQSVFRGERPSKLGRLKKWAQTANYTKRGERILTALGLWSREDESAELAAAEHKALMPAYAALENWPLRRSVSRWAGGNHSVTIKIGDMPGATGGATRAWSQNGKWSGNDSYAHLTCTIRALCFFPTLRTKDGSIILDAEKLSHRAYAVTWIRQGRGFGLKLVKGYLIRGHHIKATSLQQAQKKVQSLRKIGAEKLIASRHSLQMFKVKSGDLSKIWVGVDDSLKAGNCLSQTIAYLHTLCAKAEAEIGGIRADHLLNLRDDNYTRKAVLVAASRYI